MVDADKTVFVLGLHHLPGDYASELRDRSYPVRILDPVKKVVSTGETAGGAGDGYSFECVLPGSWEHLLINDRPHKVAKSRAGQLLGRLSVSAGQS